MALAEIAQIFICLIGSSFNVWGVFDALKTDELFKETRERRRRHLEANHMRMSRELARAAIQVVLIVMALIAIGLRGDGTTCYPDIIVANKVGMILISVLSAYTSVRERIGARRLLTLDMEAM